MHPHESCCNLQISRNSGPIDTYCFLDLSISIFHFMDPIEGSKQLPTTGGNEIKWNILPSIHHIPSLSFSINVFPHVHFLPFPHPTNQKPTESTGPWRLCKYSIQPSGAPCLSSCNPHDLYVSMVAPSLFQYMGALAFPNREVCLRGMFQGGVPVVCFAALVERQKWGICFRGVLSPELNFPALLELKLSMPKKQ